MINAGNLSAALVQYNQIVLVETLIIIVTVGQKTKTLGRSLRGELTLFSFAVALKIKIPCILTDVGIIVENIYIQI